WNRATELWAGPCSQPNRRRLILLPGVFPVSIPRGCAGPGRPPAVSSFLEDSPRLKAGNSLELLCYIAARLQRCFVFRRHVLGLALKSYRVSTDYHRASLG